ncbi:hypothetical protein HDV02_004839 [Globomyces sp. JEL0801]|nr:hypothetical protein HDV02_004839 [Globomyces sp. JEL0801]
MRVKIFTLIINVIAIQVDLFSPNVIGDALNGSGLIVNKRECLKIGVTAQSQIFNVQIDTTIADTLLPSAELNDYNGPVITYEPSEASEPVSYTNDDYTSWEGYNTDIEIGLNQTTWKSSSPIIAIYAQSDDPKLLDNDAQGIMGISFTPPTDDFKLLNVMDMWVSQNFISKNEIAFHVCQQNSNSKSWVDFGNDTPFDECSKKNVSMTLPSLPTITLSILDISFGRLSIETLQKQTPFSPGYFGGANLDTCSSIIKIPDGVHENFLLALKDSSGFNDKISKDKGYEEFLKGNMALKANPSDIVYNSLPTITFTIATDADNIELTLGPYQYMRRVGEYCKSMV